MKYLVISCESCCVGYFFDEYVRYFDNEDDANTYCAKMNEENNYMEYEVIPIKKG